MQEGAEGSQTAMFKLKHCFQLSVDWHWDTVLTVSVCTKPCSLTFSVSAGIDA